MAPIGIGLVGLNFGNHILHLLQQPKVSRLFRVAAVCDLNLSKAKAKAEELGVRAYGNLDALLADDAIRVVALVTGPAGRAGLIRKIIRAGKDVLTTKPFEVDADAADTVLREAERLGRTVHLNSPAPLLSSDLAQIAAWQKEYDLGRPVGVRADAWGPYWEKADGSWYDDPKRCPLAPVFRLGIYLIHDLIALFGPIEAVQAFHSRLRTGRPTPDNGQLALRFRNRALGNVFSSLCVDDGQSYRNTLTLNFERGTIYRNMPPALWTAAKHDNCHLQLVARRGEETILRRTKRRELSGAYQWRALHRAVTQGKSPVPPAELRERIVHGLRVIAAMARAQASDRTESVG